MRFGMGFRISPNRVRRFGLIRMPFPNRGPRREIALNSDIRIGSIGKTKRSTISGFPQKVGGVSESPNRTPSRSLEP